MKNADAITALINKTSDNILDRWTAEAEAFGRSADEYIGDQLDILAESTDRSDQDASIQIGRRFLDRLGLVTA